MSCRIERIADAELHLTEGVLDHVKLIGLAVWERRGRSDRSVTFLARHYAVNGERRILGLLRPVADAASQAPVRNLVPPGVRRVRGASY